MIRKTLIPLCLLLTIVIACKDRAPSTGDEAMLADSLNLLKAQIPAYNCAALGSKDTLYAIGNRILEAGGQQYIWNLAELDTSHYFTMEDYFVSPDRKDRLVWIEGQAGMSSGSARNLLLLLRCTDSLQVIGAEQTGDIDQHAIKDLNGDGIKEIVSESSYAWMGECGDSYQIISYKGGVRKELVRLNGMSILKCGLDSQGSHACLGDTLETQIRVRLFQQENGRYAVQQARSVSIHNGGTSDAEIRSNLQVMVDTTIIRLK